MVNYRDIVIYKISCKNLEIESNYIGSTTDFERRKREHKSAYYNINSKMHNYKLYKFIRENGGWDNFDVMMIEKYPCDSKLQAHQRERHWIEEFNSDLNCYIPSRPLSESQQLYKIRNREIILKKAKEYRQNNAEWISEKISARAICVCGCELTKRHIPRHLKSEKHLELMRNIL